MRRKHHPVKYNRVWKLITFFMLSLPEVTSDVTFAKALSIPLIENDFTAVSSQNIWVWRNGKMIPHPMKFKLIVRFASNKSWQYKFAVKMLEIIKGQ